MNKRFSLLVLIILALVGLAAGCGSSDRPRDLSLDDVRPCDLIDSSELTELRVKAEPSPIPVVEGADEDGSSCQYRPLYGGIVSVSVVTNHGIDRWTNGSMESSKAIDLARIQGYRTIRKASKADLPDDPRDMCTVYVDVAGGQSLRAITGPNGEAEPPTCDVARQFADAAVTTLMQQTA